MKDPLIDTKMTAISSCGLKVGNCQMSNRLQQLKRLDYIGEDEEINGSTSV